MTAKKDLTAQPDFSRISEINYRPFDKRYTYYTGNSKGFHCMPRGNVMQHFLNGENLGLVFKRGFTEDAPPVMISRHIIEFRLWSRPGMQGGDYIAPLYVYPLSNGLYTGSKRVPNLNQTIVDEISKRMGEEVAPLDLLDYIYAVLHSPSYRRRYKKFLKIDFPRVPYPDDAELFRRYAALGSKLRRLHLVDDVVPQSGLGDFPVAGENELERLQYSGGKVFINTTQYFGNVPADVWNFYIGGYQPAQKWLKDRKGRKLNFNEIEHYQKIVRILKETGEIMLEIDKIA